MGKMTPNRRFLCILIGITIGVLALGAWLDGYTGVNSETTVIVPAVTETVETPFTQAQTFGNLLMALAGFVLVSAIGFGFAYGFASGP